MPPTERPRLAAHNETVQRALLPPLVLLILLVVLLLWLIRVLVSAAQWVEHSDAVIAQTHETLTLMVDAETGQRGYLVSGKSLFLEPYEQSQATLPRQFQTLSSLVRDNREQAARVQEFRASYEQWLQNARSEINLRRRGDAAWLAGFNTARGKSLMDRVRGQVQEFIASETTLRQQRESRVHAAMRNTLIGGGMGTVALGSLLVWTTRRQMRSLSDQYGRALEEEQAARNQALQERERYLATLTSIGDGVLATDARGRITLINPITERLTGWSQKEAAGKDSKEVFDIVHEDTGVVVPCPVDEVIRENKTVLLANHTSLRHRDGTKVVIEDSAAPVRDEAGDLAGVVLVFRDVTERKERELQIRAATEALRESAAQQRRLVREMLSSVTDGKLLLVDMEQDLPPALTPWSETLVLTTTTLRTLRKQLMAAVESMGFPGERAHDLLTAVGEASMNAVHHAGGGTARIYIDAGRSLLQVWIQDSGKGIREEVLHRATLEKGWSDGGTLGHGFFLILHCVDRTYLLTGPTGTTIVLEQEKIAPDPFWL